MSEKHPHLSKAPIVEAAIEIKVATSTPVEGAFLSAAKDSLRGTFAKSDELRYFRSMFTVGQQGQPEQKVDMQPGGFRLESEDQRYVAQLRPDAVVVSRIAPYTRWEDFIAVVEKVWNEYAQAVKPTSVRRLGVRYINRLEFTEDMIDFDKVLTAGPRIPASMPQELVTFSSRQVVPLHALGCLVGIVQAFEGAPPPSVPALVLDLDAFTEETLEPTFSAIRPRLEALREAKNMAFFGSLSPAALESLK